MVVGSLRFRLNASLHLPPRRYTMAIHHAQDQDFRRYLVAVVVFVLILMAECFAAVVLAKLHINPDLYRERRLVVTGIVSMFVITAELAVHAYLIMESRSERVRWLVTWSMAILTGFLLLSTAIDGWIALLKQ